MSKLLCVGLGGFLGCILRYLIISASYLISFPSSFPWGVLLANTLGCLLVGFLGALVELKFTLNSNLIALIFTGFLGGLTTFSTYSYDTFNFLRENHLGYALLNTTSQIILGLVAIWIGYRALLLIINY